jgi:hypothetical protein
MAPTFSGCCGQPVKRKHRIVPNAVELPANPRVAQGVRLLYLGSGPQSLRGQGSGLVYHISELRRWFMVSPHDVNTFLRRRDVILAP